MIVYKTKINIQINNGSVITVRKRPLLGSGGRGNVFKKHRIDAYLIDFVHFPGDEGPFLLGGLPVGGVLHVLEVETVRQVSHLDFAICQRQNEYNYQNTIT